MPTTLLLPGQGSQYRGMCIGLYRDLPAFAAAVDEVLRHLGPAGDELRSDWLSARPRLPVDDARRSQPLLFAIDYALGRLLLDLGLRPAVLLGHSVGEIAAATLAGVFDLGSAVRVVQQRAGQLADAPAGGMVAVAASRDEVAPHLRPGVDIGAINAPRQTVIAGADEPLRGAVVALERFGFTCVPVPALAPLHSSALQPMVAAALPLLRSLSLRSPEIAVMSGYTALPLTDAEAVEPLYWARHPVDPVLFWPALHAVLAGGPQLLVECGPGQRLTTIARRHPEARSGRSDVLSLIDSAVPDPDREAERFSASAARLGLGPVPDAGVRERSARIRPDGTRR